MFEIERHPEFNDIMVVRILPEYFHPGDGKDSYPEYENFRRLSDAIVRQLRFRLSNQRGSSLPPLVAMDFSDANLDASKFDNWSSMHYRLKIPSQYDNYVRNYGGKIVICGVEEKVAAKTGMWQPGMEQAIAALIQYQAAFRNDRQAKDSESMRLPDHTRLTLIGCPDDLKGLPEEFAEYGISVGLPGTLRENDHVVFCINMVTGPIVETKEAVRACAGMKFRGRKRDRSNSANK